MPRVVLGAKAREDAKVQNFVKRIIRCLPKNVEVARTLGNSPTKQSYRTNEVYPTMLVEAIKILELAGYEIKEK